MYWSVLSNAQFLGRLPADVVQKFLASGQIDVNRIEQICAQIDYDFAQCRNLLDFGCGVGRLLVNLPASIHGIHGVDFSSAHLAEASKNAARFGKAQNVSFYPVETLVDLQTLPKGQDIIHSFIVLQHNTPPVMEKVVGDLLPLLATGGIAMLHIPIAKACYQFDVNTYLQDPRSGTTMEMHILPKANLHQLATKAHCDIVYSCCVGGCGGDLYSEIVVFRKRR